MLTPAWTLFRPHPVQVSAWRSPKRFVALPAGRGSGKTEMAKRRLVRFLPVKKEWPDPRYFYGAPTEHQAMRIAWQSLLNLIPKEWLDGQPNKSEHCIRTVFGSELFVVGLDKPQRIEGPQWDGCVIDESCDIKPGTFDLNVLPALTWRKGWCWRIGVPKRQGWGAKEYREWYEEAVNEDIVDRAGFTWPSSDIVPPETLVYARNHMDAKDYNEQFNAQWETAGGGIFHAFNREYNVRPCPYDPRRPIIVGSDFNVDPMCWVLGHAYKDRMEWFDELFIRDTNTPATLKALYARYSSHSGGFRFYGDATGRARKTSASRSDYLQILNHEGFKRLGRTVHYPKANPPVMDRFAACNAMFCNANGFRRAFVDPRCKRLIADIEARYFKPQTTEPADSGDVGHPTDAMGYPTWALFPVTYRQEGATSGISTTRGTRKGAA